MSARSLHDEVDHVVDADIRPLLKIHGGGISVVAVTPDGLVRLEFEGACRGCALQSVTYAVGVRQRLLEVPGVVEVSMNGIKISKTAIERVAHMYRGYTFRMDGEPAEDRAHKG